MKTTCENLVPKAFWIAAGFLALLSLPLTAQIGADPAKSTETAPPAAEQESADTPEAAPGAGEAGAMNLETLPQTTQAGLAEAAAALNAGNSAKAAELARAYLQEKPDSLEARLVLAKSLDPFFHRRDRVKLYKEAYELAEKNGGTSHQKAMIELELGLIYEYLEQFQDAEKHLKAAAQNYEMYDRGTNARVYSALGHLFLRTDREEQGIEALKIAAEKFGSATARKRLELKEFQGYFRETRANAGGGQ